jgi:hypothetical protein
MKKNRKMKKLLEFSEFNESGVVADKPPVKTPTRTKPGTKPARPTPIRRQKPGYDPKPMATVEEVFDRYQKLMKAKQNKKKE